MVDTESILANAEVGITEYLNESLRLGRLSEHFYEEAKKRVPQNLEAWLRDPGIDRLSPSLKLGIRDAVEEERWEEIVNAFLRFVNFGTGGIRQVMAYDKLSILAIAEADGVDARVLKGPNTINNITILKSAFGVARFLTNEGESAEPSAVVGYDSRIQGAAFAEAITEVLLAEGLTVFLFDEPVPYPEVTFAIPYLQADVGMFISASHNDYRYNGFKLSGPNGAQIPPEVRDRILSEYILPSDISDIRTISLREGTPEVGRRLVFLGGDEPLPSFDYRGCKRIDMHREHTSHVKTFMLRAEELRTSGVMDDFRIAFSAFNGSGRRAVPRILGELGFSKVHSIRSLDPLNGLFKARLIKLTKS